MPGQPIADAGFLAHEQGFKAVKPGVGMFDHDPAGVKFGVAGGVVVGLPVGGAAVAGNVGLDVAPGALLAKVLNIKGFFGVQKQPGDGNSGRLERGVDFPEQGVEPVGIVVVARLRAGAGQGLAPVFGQEQGRGGASFFAALVADGLLAVLGGCMATVELDAGTGQVGPVFA